MDYLELISIILRIVAALFSIGFTYIKYRDYIKLRKQKGSPDAATSDEQGDSNDLLS